MWHRLVPFIHSLLYHLIHSPTTLTPSSTPSKILSLSMLLEPRVVNDTFTMTLFHKNIQETLTTNIKEINFSLTLISTKSLTFIALPAEFTFLYTYIALTRIMTTVLQCILCSDYFRVLATFCCHAVMTTNNN